MPRTEVGIPLEKDWSSMEEMPAMEETGSSENHASGGALALISIISSFLSSPASDSLSTLINFNFRSPKNVFIRTKTPQPQVPQPCSRQRHPWEQDRYLPIAKTRRIMKKAQFEYPSSLLGSKSSCMMHFCPSSLFAHKGAVELEMEEANRDYPVQTEENKTF